jgi:hypothetical protein
MRRPLDADAIGQFRHSGIDRALSPRSKIDDPCSFGRAGFCGPSERRWRIVLVNPSSTKAADTPAASAHSRARSSGLVQERPVSELRDQSSDNPTEVDVLDAKERWNEYRLSDGTTMRVKSVVIAVFRDGQQTADGEPVYSMKSTLITDVRTAGLSAKLGA